MPTVNQLCFCFCAPLPSPCATPAHIIYPIHGSFGSVWRREFDVVDKIPPLLSHIHMHTHTHKAMLPWKQHTLWFSPLDRLDVSDTQLFWDIYTVTFEIQLVFSVVFVCGQNYHNDLFPLCPMKCSLLVSSSLITFQIYPVLKKITRIKFNLTHLKVYCDVNKWIKMKNRAHL